MQPSLRKLNRNVIDEEMDKHETRRLEHKRTLIRFEIHEQRGFVLTVKTPKECKECPKTTSKLNPVNQKSAKIIQELTEKYAPLSELGH
jgi:hypothetical protein